jgi:hypothetical protein
LLPIAPIQDGCHPSEWGVEGWRENGAPSCGDCLQGVVDIVHGEVVQPVRWHSLGAHHRPDAAHLEHQPLDDPAAALRIGGHQKSRLFRKIDHDRPGFEHREPIVDNGRDAAVGVEHQECG